MGEGHLGGGRPASWVEAGQLAGWRQASWVEAGQPGRGLDGGRPAAQTKLSRVV